MRTRQCCQAKQPGVSSKPEKSLVLQDYQPLKKLTCQIAFTLIFVDSDNIRRISKKQHLKCESINQLMQMHEF